LLGLDAPSAEEVTDELIESDWGRGLSVGCGLLSGLGFGLGPRRRSFLAPDYVLQKLLEVHGLCGGRSGNLRLRGLSPGLGAAVEELVQEVDDFETGSPRLLRR
jgi:hypothetical protein